MRKTQMWVGRGLRIDILDVPAVDRTHPHDVGPFLTSIVDIPAHAYQFSFESWTDWSKFYAGASEILQYWKRVADKYDVKRFIKFGHKCVEARWNDETSKWHVKIENVQTGEVTEDIGDVFVTGIGVLNDWKWPDIKGLDELTGPVIHSANWDESFDAKVRVPNSPLTSVTDLDQDKTVAVIGAGSSGIQIVPTLQPHVKSMDHYVRGRTW